jgi:hypothetical protein
MEAGIANAGKGFYQAFTRISVSETDPNPPEYYHDDHVSIMQEYTSVYVHPYNGNTYPQWNGSKFEPVEFSLLPLFFSVSINLDGVYDVFLWQDSETVRAVFGTKWTTDTERGTGLGTTELETLNGVSVNKNSMTVNSGTYSYTLPARMGTFIGTVAATDGGARWDLHAKNVWNKYNKLPQSVVHAEMNLNSAETKSFSRYKIILSNFFVLGEAQKVRLTYIAHITQYDAGTAVYKCWVHASMDEFDLVENSQQESGVPPWDAVYTPEFSGITSTIIKTTTTFISKRHAEIGVPESYWRVATTAGTAILNYSGSKILVELEM